MPDGANQSLEAAAQELTRAALETISRDGLSATTLARIGQALSGLAEQLPRYPDGGAEVEIRREDDGTFELVLRQLDANPERRETLGYDTWSVFAPSHGRIEIGGRSAPPGQVKVGDSRAFPQGEIISMRALGGPAQVLCLFGVAREHLPPPRRRP